jgi:hypothetical protein
VSDSPIRDAISKPIDIPDLPANEVTVAVEAKQGGDVGATVGANVDVGKPGGWSMGAAAEWWRSTGASVKGWFTWKGK